MKQLRVRNRQRARIIDTRFLRGLIGEFLDGLLGLKEYDISIELVSASRMAEINQQFLQHEGSTDVITFDYSTGYEDLEVGSKKLCGEIFISVQDAVDQGREFKTKWQEEIIRYTIHGVLHLLGYDDRAAKTRKIMKKKENLLLARLVRSQKIQKLGK